MAIKVILKIKVLPWKPYNQVLGQMDNGAIKIALKAKPIEGQANRELINYLSKKTQLSKSQISIISGSKSKTKMVKIDAVNENLILERLLKD